MTNPLAAAMLTPPAATAATGKKGRNYFGLHITVNTVGPDGSTHTVVIDEFGVQESLATAVDAILRKTNDAPYTNSKGFTFTRRTPNEQKSEAEAYLASLS